MGHRVEILRSRVNHFALASPTSLPSREIVDGVRLFGVPGVRYRGNGVGRILNMVGFAAALPVYWRHFRGADLVVGSSPSPLSALSSWILSRIFGKAFVFEIRDFWPDTLIDLGSLARRGMAARVLFRIERFLVHHSDGVIVIPPDGLAYLKEHDLEAKRTLVLPNFSRDSVSFSSREAFAVPEPARTWISAGRNGSAKLFCYAGSLGLANGVVAVVDAFIALKHDDARLIIVGDGPERERLAARAKGDGRVLFVGQVGKETALAIIDLCDVAVFHLQDAPVFRYGLSPNKLIDYLFAGKPILYAGPDVLNPTSGANASISVAPGDVAGIRNALDAFIEMEEGVIADYGAAAYEHALTAFSAVSAARTFESFALGVHSHADRFASDNL